MSDGVVATQRCQMSNLSSGYKIKYRLEKRCLNHQPHREKATSDGVVATQRCQMSNLSSGYKIKSISFGETICLNHQPHRESNE